MRNHTPDRTTDLATLAADYDWQEVFGCAGAPGRNNNIAPKRVEGATCAETKFTIDDVAYVVDASPGENDGAHWMIVGVLNDTRAFFIEAGCDYTGWDCRSWGRSFVADDLDAILQWGMTDEARERLPAVHAAVKGGVL